MKLNNLKDKWESFGWETIEIDGHDLEKIFEAIDNKRI